MTRTLEVVDARDPGAVLDGLRRALSGDGPAILPHVGAPTGLPETVEQRVAVVVETSGSTGRPKRVTLSADALLASAAASDVQLGGPGQWMLAVPTEYIAGVNVLVRSIAAETEPVVMNPEGFTAERFVEAASALTGERRFTSLVPTQLARIIEADSALETLRSFDRILIGGQSVPVDLIARALELGLNITRTYGSTETSGGCVYDGVPIGNTKLRIVDDLIEIAGSVLAEGYLNDLRRTAFSFRDREGERWYRSDDMGELHDGVLTVTGRVGDVIISGGVKVSLSEVEAAVRSLPGLQEAVVIAAPSPEWGEVPVVASVVGMPLDTLRDAVAAQLGRPAAPDRIMHLDAMPMLDSGKPDRVALAALALK
ncbi:MAG: o-succinylbenzoate--CoA ligase [Salinibacterium sp.]|nr:MAG: o-succinylbenzoate--CoA ligase [Salinibacterium sp.]